MRITYNEYCFGTFIPNQLNSEKNILTHESNIIMNIILNIECYYF